MIRSHVSSQRSASAGISTARTTPRRRSMSIRRKSARKMRVKIPRPTENASPAIPRIEEIACGTESARFVAPCWTFSAPPESPAHESSPESRSWSTISGRLFTKSRSAPTSGTSRRRASTVTTTVEPSTTIVAEIPRPHPVQRTNVRSGISNTSARKTPRKTRISVSLIEMTAAASAATAAARSSVRKGMERAAARASSPSGSSPASAPRPILTARTARVTACRPGPGDGP